MHLPLRSVSKPDLQFDFTTDVSNKLRLSSESSLDSSSLEGADSGVVEPLDFSFTLNILFYERFKVLN